MTRDLSTLRRPPWQVYWTVLLGIACSATFGEQTAWGQTPVQPPTIEQQVRQQDDLDYDEKEEEEEEEDHEEEEESAQNAIDELRELKEELLAESEDIPSSDSHASVRIIDRLVDLFRQRQSLEAAVAKAEANDERAINRYEARWESLEASIERNQLLLELRFEERELAEEIDDGRFEDDPELLAILQTLKQGVTDTGQLLRNLIDTAENARDETNELDELTTRVERSYEKRIELPREALELLEEFWEAEDDQDVDRAREIRNELERIKRIAGIPKAVEKVRSDAGKQPLRVSEPPSLPSFQSIAITPETLNQFDKADLQKDVAPLLQRYCIDCHGDASSAGELNFEKLLAVSPIVKRRQQWLNVLEQTKNHVMPPEDADQPTPKEREQIVLSLHNLIHKFDYSTVRNPGYEHTRRLTHREYSNTVRDLFGVAIDVVDRFPPDLTATGGFDNSANSLFIQPLLMERYVGLAEFVVDQALPSDAAPDDTNGWKRILISQPAESGGVSQAATQVMRRFLYRAFRRPPTSAETSSYVSRIAERVEAGARFEEAIKVAIRTVLITPSFLLLSETAQPENEEAFRVGQFELASRLSYFLWASMPDDQLLRLAKRNKLSDPEVLKQQVRRMLKDPRAESLGSTFAAQWLGSQHLGTRVRLDPIDNPWCTDTLMAAMREETSRFFNYLVQKNRPITELVSADYTFVNQELAQLYRLEGVTGTTMRRVDVANRGGIFGHGSLLAVTSFPGRTSPVVRGKWILDTVLGTPPPPPPPNVSELDEDLESRERLTFREKLELHREKPNCYACHSEMDPLGFSLEQFDWFGRQRSRRGRRRIDATGRLPNGTVFHGLSGLKHVVIEQRQDDLIRQVTQKLLSYALGRQLEYYDEVAVRKIIDRIRVQDSRFGSLIHEITQSYPFQYKQNPTNN